MAQHSSTHSPARGEDARFSVNFDYRCPFARNANEHVVAALDGGAPWQVDFLPFSLSQVHVPDGEPPVWDQPDRREDLVAVGAGIVLRDRFPELFRAGHLELFSTRHDRGDDLRDAGVVRAALERAGADPDAVFAELDDGWPFETMRKEHEQSVAEHAVFGVPTFVLDGSAVFVRLMTRPRGDATLAKRTVDRVLDLLSNAGELNEFKHTTIPR